MSETNGPARSRGRRRERIAGWLALHALLALMAPSLAEAQTPVPQPFCLGGNGGVCLSGGTWDSTDAGFRVRGGVRLRLPNGMAFDLGNVDLTVGTTPETASLDGTVSLRFDVGDGPLRGMRINSASATLKIGHGRNLRGPARFAVGQVSVPKDDDWFYVYAKVAAGTTLRMPGGQTVDVPTPADGLDSAFLIGFDPRPNAAPGLIFYLGGGFTSLMTQGTVTEGSVMISLNSGASRSLGNFRTSPTGSGTVAVVMTPTFSTDGSLSLFQGGDDSDSTASSQSSSSSSSSTSTSSTTSTQSNPPPKRKPIPITVVGGMNVDLDGNDDGSVNGWLDTRLGGNVGITIDDVGLGQSLELGNGTFYQDPSQRQCGELGQILSRVDSVNRTMLAGTPLEFLDPGSAGYRFDALACASTSMARLSAGNVSAGSFPLANAAIGFGRNGVTLQGTLSFLGSNVLLRGTVDGRSLRLRSTAGLNIGGRSISNGSLELTVGRSSARLRFRGFVEISGQRFAIDQTFETPPVNLTLPEQRVEQTLDLGEVGDRTLGADASVTLRGSIRGRLNSGSWGLTTSGGIGWVVHTHGPAGSDTVRGDYDVSFSVGSGGISVRLREWKIPGTNLVVIPGSDRTFSRAYSQPDEEAPPLVVAPAREGRFVLASNVRAPAASTGLAGPRVHIQDSIVTLGGNVERASGTLDLLGVLPPGLRPSNTLVFGAMQTPRANGASSIAVRILPTGEVRLFAPSTTITGVSLEGISFTRDVDSAVAFTTFPSTMAAYTDTYEPPTAVGRGPFVRLQGMLKRVGTGTIGELVRLPSGLRRISKTLTFELMTSAGAIQANLEEDGRLTYLSGPSEFEWVSLSGIEFSPNPWARRELSRASGIQEPSDSFLGPRIHRFGGLVWLQGRIDRAGSQTLIGTLPASMRPSQTRVFHVNQTHGYTARIEVRPTGEIVLVGAGSEPTVSLSGVRFYLDDATSELALARQALYDFAKGIENPDMRDAWDSAEDAWLAAVLAANDVAALRTQLQQLVGYMNSDSTIGGWNDAKQAWLAGLAAATTPADFARSLRDLEPYMERGAMTDTWDDVDSSWRAELDGYATP